MTFSSWTYDQKGIDYLPYSDTIGTSNYLENEGWYLLKTTGKAPLRLGLYKTQIEIGM